MADEAAAAHQASGSPTLARGQPGADARSTSPSPPPVPAAEAPFGAALEPILRKSCDGRLSAVCWFRTDWQRGGALTGYANYKDDRGLEQPVVVKLPVPPGERAWLERLQPFQNVAPRLYAHGETLNGYDMAWVVMERLHHGPLGHTWDGREFDLLAQAAARFYASAQQFPVHGDVPTRQWDAVLRLAREHVQHDGVRHQQRWKTAIKSAHKKLKEWLKVWNDRSTDTWCHGDLHLANAMTREAPPKGPAVLLDFALTHRGHWVEDAVYFEHLFWARRPLLRGRKICSQIAHERRDLGLRVEPDWPRLAGVKRALLALSTPAYMAHHDGDPHHIDAALEVLEIEGKA